MVEARGCRVHGPGQWDQVPLALAARYGRLDILDYLAGTRKGAEVDQSTLRAAIESGKPEVVTHLLDHYDLDWTAREYELAFASPHPGMLKYALGSAIDGACFEPWYQADEDDKRCRILRAARDAVASLDGSSQFNDVANILRTRIQGALFYIGAGEHDYSFLFDTMAQRPQSFPTVWELVHQALFEGKRYADLDGYSARPVIDELFRTAVALHQDEAFYVLLQYALPRFKEVIKLARESNNGRIGEYLAHYCE
jgi:hypothetical protein